MKHLSIQTLIIIAIVAVAVLVIGVFAIQDHTKEAPTPVLENGGGQEDQGENGEDMTETVDTSDWQTYRNDEYGFSFEYPSGWVIEERYEEESDPETRIKGFRYILLRTDDGKFSISLGIKPSNQGEWYFTHPWYTGVPAGNLTDIGIEKFAFGLLKKQSLVYSSKNQEKIQMVRYCAVSPSTTIDECNNFLIEDNLLGRVEVYPGDEKGNFLRNNDWQDIQSQIDQVLSTLKL